MLRAKLVIALAAAAIATAGCGSGAGGSPRPLLERAFGQPVGSAAVTVDLELHLTGDRALAQPVVLRLAGPYRSNGGRRLPSFDWNLDLINAARSLTAELVSTGSDFYVTLGGQSYDAGPDRVARVNDQLARGSGGRPLGLRAYRWLRDLHDEGSASVGGGETTHVRAGVDVAAMLSDLNRVYRGASNALRGAGPLSPARVAAIEAGIRNPTLDVYVGRGDGRLRRVALSLDFQVPPSQRSRFAGASGGTLDLAIELDHLGRAVSITAPPNAQPLSQLLPQLGAAAPARPSGTSAGKLRKYDRCIRAAGSNGAAAARCLSLLE